MSKYKVGDIVRIKNRKQLGIVIEIEGYECPYKVETNDGKLWYDEEQLELVKSGKTYEQGLEDAWELARKLFQLKQHEREKIFKESAIRSVIDGCLVKEVLAKLKAYEEQGKIKVGDVIKAKDFVSNVEILVTKIYTEDSTFDGFKIMPKSEFGGTYYDREIELFEKTGKHIDIQQLLDSIGE